MNDSETLKHLADEINCEADAAAAVEALREKAAGGDCESIELLTKLTQCAREERLRKELFGI